MPPFFRSECQTPREQQLWDACMALEARLSCTRTLLLVELQDGFAGLVADLRERHFGDAVKFEPPTGLERAAKARDLARARCYRRNLSDAARRDAVKEARSLGALPPDFDEASLPWKSRPKSATRKAATVARTRKDPMRTRYLVQAAGDLPPRGTPAYDLLVAGRLARLSGHWITMKNSMLALWKLIRDSGPGLPRGATYSDGVRACDGATVLYRTGGAEMQSIAWSDGIVRYPGGLHSLQGELWYYADGGVARCMEAFYAPGEPMLAKVILGDEAARGAAPPVRQAVARLVDSPEEQWAKLPAELAALAALELLLRPPHLA